MTGMRHARRTDGLSIPEKIAAVNEAERVGVAAAARRAGVSRTTLYGWRRVAEKHGPEALPPPTRTGRPLEANRLPEDIERGVIELARSRPTLGAALRARLVQATREERPKIIPHSSVIRAYIDNLLALLGTDKEKARELLRRHMPPLVLTPEAAGYRITGGFNLSLLLDSNGPATGALLSS